MKNKREKNMLPSKPRIDAEARLNGNGGRKQITPSVETAQKSLHELQEFQIELEMQNEELRQTRAEIEASLDRFAEFYDFAPVGYFTLSRDGIIVETNFSGASLIGLERSKLSGQYFSHYVSAEYRPDFSAFLSKVFKGNGNQLCDTSLQKNVLVSPIFVHINAIAKKTGKECYLVVSDITERTRMVKALLEKDTLLSESQRIAHSGSWSLAVNGDTVRWSDETYRIYGVTPDTFVPTLSNLIKLIHSKDQASMREWIGACLAGQQPDVLEFRAVRPDGDIRTLQVHGDLQYAQNNVPIRIIGTVQDITERKLTENALHESEELFRTIAESVSDMIAVLDINGRRIYNNPAYLRTFGETPSSGSDAFTEIHPEDRERIKSIFYNTVESGVGDRTEFRLLLKDGSIRHIESEGNVVHDLSGDVSKVIVVSRDITKRKQAEEQLQRQANYDMLTELPNRRMLYERLHYSLSTAKRDKTRLALLFLDLNMFKLINDTLGHDVGDLLLKETANRIQNCMRESDTAARMGGDEFVMILPCIETEQDAMVVAEKIRDALNLPFELAGHSLKVSPSIGIAVYPEHGSNAEELVKNADNAMYCAKETGCNAVKCFTMEKQKNKE